MMIRHESTPLDEHRIVVSMTVFEARLLVNGNETVRRLVLRRVRLEMEGCDEHES